MFQLNPQRPIGHNRLAQMAPIFADRCGFTNANKHKAHGKRALGIRVLSNSSVLEHMKLKASRHSNLKSHAKYQRVTNENNEKKYKDMNPSLLNNSIGKRNSQDSWMNFVSLSSKPMSPTQHKAGVDARYHQNGVQRHPTPNQIVINIGNTNFHQGSPT